MGMLVAGRWTHDDDAVRAGAFVRRAGVHDDAIDLHIVAAMRADPGRIHLIASWSCPWSHRALIARQLKGLTEDVPVQIAGGRRVEGYPANGGQPWLVPGADRRIVHLHELYTLDDPDYTGRVTVPVLWDSRTCRILSNESTRILAAFDAAAPAGGGLDFTLRPPDLAQSIDGLNAEIYEGFCNAVYRAGFARRQNAYDAAVADVFTTLDMLDARLAHRRYLFGDTVTEADWRLFPTLARFDTVYHTHFRCCRRRLVDYPHLWAYTRDLYAWHGIANTLDIAAIRAGYFLNDGDTNPYGIVAVAPEIDWDLPHGRAALGTAQVALRDGGAVEVDPATLQAVSG